MSSKSKLFFEKSRLAEKFGSSKFSGSPEKYGLEKFISDETYKTYANQIISGLYLGDINSANDLDWLKSQKITNILGMIDGQIKHPGMNYLIHGNILDHPDENIVKYFGSCYQFISNALSKNERVLVHCYAGISRSTTIVVMYLMYSHKLKLLQALEFVSKRRSVACPNFGFQLQLQIFEGLSDDKKTELLFKENKDEENNENDKDEEVDSEDAVPQ